MLITKLQVLCKYLRYHGVIKISLMKYSRESRDIQKLDLNHRFFTLTNTQKQIQLTVKNSFKHK